MRPSVSFAAGLVAGLALSLAVAAHADWNGNRAGGSPDRQLLERLARASEDSARHLAEIARSESESARALTDASRRCR